MRSRTEAGAKSRLRTVLIAALPVSLLTIGGAVPAASATARTAATAAPYTIYLSNNYLGNTWRVQMEKTAEAAVNYAPLKGKVVLRVENAAQTVPAQITSLEAIIARHPDAILIDASSPTALNPEIATACAQHIVVVNFDQPVTAPCAYRVTSNTNAAAPLGAEWIAGVLHGKGNVYMDSGLPGAPLSNAGVQLNLQIFKKYPGIHVVGYYQSQYAIGPEQSGVASLLSAHPDVNALMSQAYCTGAIAAFQSAGHALVPHDLCCVQRHHGGARLGQGRERLHDGQPSVPVGRRHAHRRAGAERPERASSPAPSPSVLLHRRSDPAAPPGGTSAKIVVGKDAFPKDSPGLSLPASPPWTNIPVSAVTP